MPHTVFGFFASVTSARIGLAAPWSWRTASAAAGWPTQVACRAAHAGTSTGLGWLVGLGLACWVGLGVGLGEGLGVGLGFLLGELTGGARGPLGVHAARAARTRRRAIPFLTLDPTNKDVGALRERGGGAS